MIQLEKKERFLSNDLFDELELNNLMKDACKKMKTLIDRYGYEFVHTCSYNDRYYPTSGFEWTKGFQTGMYWYSYLFSHNDEFKKAAIAQSLELARVAHQGHEGIQNHDVGFIYSLSDIAGYEITGNTDMLTGARLASNVLTERFIDTANVIQAWGKMNEKHQNTGRIIIDTLMNLPILFKMTNLTGDEKYRQIALAHFSNAMSVLVRPDYSTYHTYYFDSITGHPLMGKTHQGKNDESMWARGQAWGIYGTALAYKYNRDNKELIELGKSLLNKFLNYLPDDLVCPWDFDYDDYMYVLKDASTMPIVICGILEMIELGDFFTKSEAQEYEKIAHNLLRALLDNGFISSSDDKWEDGLIKHSVYAFPNKGINEFVLWGDYFYVEALMRIITKNKWVFW